MNRRLFTILGLGILLLATPAYAQGGDPPIPIAPSANNYVLDTLNWLDDAQEQEINTIIRQLAGEDKAEIYVATLNDCGNNKTQYRRDVFNSWGIGSRKSDGGLLILVCWYGGDTARRSVEIKTDENMQQIIPDNMTASTVEEEFVPAFQENHPGVGLVSMVTVFNNMIRSNQPPAASPSSPLEINPAWLVIGLIILLVLLNRVFKKGGTGGGWVGGDFGSGGDFGGSGGGGGGGDGGGSSTSF